MKRLVKLFHRYDMQYRRYEKDKNDKNKLKKMNVDLKSRFDWLDSFLLDSTVAMSLQHLGISCDVDFWTSQIVQFRTKCHDIDSNQSQETGVKREEETENFSGSNSNSSSSSSASSSHANQEKQRNQGIGRQLTLALLQPAHEGCTPPAAIQLLKMLHYQQQHQKKHKIFTYSWVNYREASAGWTPLLICASQGFVPAAKLLIELKCDVDMATNKEIRTPLHIACEKGHLNVVKLLVQANAKLNSRDRYGMSPYQRAIECKQRLVVSHLQKIMTENSGINANSTSIGVGMNGQMVLDSLVAGDRQTAMKMLLKKTEAVKDNNNSNSDITVDIDVNVKDPQCHFTPLLMSAYQLDLEMVKLLLFLKADVTATTKQEKRSVVHIVCEKIFEKSMLNLVSPGDAADGSCGGNSPNLELLVTLLQAKCSHSVRDANGMTPLMHVLQCVKVNKPNNCVKNGVNEDDEKDKNAAMIIRCLVDAKANPYDYVPQTIARIICSNSNSNSISISNITSLHLACASSAPLPLSVEAMLHFQSDVDMQVISSAKELIPVDKIEELNQKDEKDEKKQRNCNVRAKNKKKLMDILLKYKPNKKM